MTEQDIDKWPNEKERLEANAAIRAGLADMLVGNYRLLSEFMDEFREKHDLGGDWVSS